MLGNLNQRQRAWADHDDAWFSAVAPRTADPFQRPHTARVTSLTPVALCDILPRTAKPLGLQPAAQCPVTRSNHMHYCMRHPRLSHSHASSHSIEPLKSHERSGVTSQITRT